MAEEIIQVILRNTGSQGYETIYSSSNVEIDTELLPYILPRSKTNSRIDSYYFKLPVNKDVTLVKLVQDDGKDQYNRFKAIVYLFLIPNEVYDTEGGLIYFASPLWLQTIKKDSNKPLNYETDFKKKDEFLIKFEGSFNRKFQEYLLDKLLLYENVIIAVTNDGLRENDTDERYLLYQILAYIDYKLPLLCRNQLTIKSLASKLDLSLANCMIIDKDNIAIQSDDKTFVINYPFSEEESLVFESGLLPKKILDCETIEEREMLGKSILDKEIVRQNWISTQKYNQLAERFGIKDKSIFFRLFKNHL